MNIRIGTAVVWQGLLAGLWLLGVVIFLRYWPMPLVAGGWTALILLVAIAMGVGSWHDHRKARLARVVKANAPERDRTDRWQVPIGGQSRSAALQRSLVAIAGVGDIGSRVAVAVVQSSVTRLAVADIDVVESDNIGQSAFRSVDVGESKVDAIGVICREINPAVELRFCESDLQLVPELELGIWAGGAALLVLSLDDPRALLRLHDMFYRRVPMVAGGVHDGGASGHVVFTLPGKTACLRCALGVSGPNDLVQVRGNSASADDVQRVAGETASTVIAMLDPLRQKQLQANRNLLFITNRAGDGTQNRQSSWMEPGRNPKCRVCGEGGRL